MKILCSACLLGENCKYNGNSNYNNAVINYIAGHEVLSVCPEVLGGLSIPRKPVELLNGMAIHSDGTSVDREFRTGAKKAVDLAVSEEVDLAILQSRSPSCGVKQIYDGTFSHSLISGQGIFARMLVEAGIKVMDAEDIHN